MKRADYWTVWKYGNEIGTASLNQIRLIQADALRWAGSLSGVLHRAKVIERAELLERLAAGSNSFADHEAEKQI